MLKARQVLQRVNTQELGGLKRILANALQHLRLCLPQKVTDHIKGLTGAVCFIGPVPAIVITIAHPGETNAHPGAAAEFIVSALVSLCKEAHTQLRCCRGEEKESFTGAVDQGEAAGISAASD